MHPALFLLNSCILYVEQIIQKKRRKSFNICNVPIYQKQGANDMKIYQDPGIQTIYRKE